MLIDNKTVVSVTYQLHEGDANGQLVEQVNAEKPFTFLFGAGQLLAKFEDNLRNLGVDDTFAFGIKSAEAYGLKDPNAIVDLPLDVFVIDGKIATDFLKLGQVVPMRDSNGNMLQGTVLAVDDNGVKMDFNHPMAGVDLYFTGKVLAVRAATQSEVEHGHVHGPGGHHHHH